MNEPAPLLFDPHMAVVRVRGADAARFLQAQLTSDVEAMAPGDAGLGAWCSPKGRVRNLFRLAARRPGPGDGGGGGFDLLAPAGETDGLAQRLRLFVLRSKVVVEPGPERVLGVAGAGAEPFVRRVAGGAPAPGRTLEAAADGEPVGGSVLALRPAEDPPRFLLALGGEAAARHEPSAPDAEWRQLEIAAGVAWLDEATREAFLPQMLDLERLGALSFDKGCYPGQEIVARTHYLGELKRRLYRAEVAAGAAPAPGDRVLADGGRPAGVVVAAAAETDGGGAALLAVLRIDLAEAGPLALDDGRPVALAPPPPAES